MNKFKIVLIHILVWVLYIALNALNYVPENIAPGVSIEFLVFKQYTYYSIFIILFYINAYLLYPRFFSSGNFIKYIMSLLAAWVFSYLLYLLHGYMLYLISGDYEYFSIRLPFYLGVVFNFVYFTGLSIAWRLFIDWRKYQSLQDELTKAKLALLNFQISPHFLFNTLNNIYLLVKRKDESAPEAVLMLSDLLRSTLTENIGEKVSINSEITYLGNFIQLQKLRMEYPDNVIFEKSGNINGHRIYPFLLIPFIENAFKHGDFTGKGAKISIFLELIDNTIKLKVHNKYKAKNKDSISGIGIKNVKNRLEHFYNSAYILKISDNNNEYTVELKIKL